MHTIPNLLDTEDTFLFGLTMRQGLILFVGAGTSYLLFENIFALIADPGGALMVGLAVALLFFGAMVALAFVRRDGRGLEEWGVVLLLYASRPKIYLWSINAPDVFERLDLTTLTASAGKEDAMEEELW